MYTKYKAQKTIVDNIKFDSGKEAQRYLQLKMMEKEGLISDLRLQPEYTLIMSFVYDGHRERKIVYRADFAYKTVDGLQIVEDVKGFRTAVYKIKRKLFLNYLLQKDEKIKFIET